MKGIIVEGDEDVRAEAGGKASLGVIFEKDGGGIRFKREKVMHPCRRFGKLVGQNVGNLCPRVFADTLSSGASKAVADGIVQKIVSIEVDACGSVKPKRVP